MTRELDACAIDEPRHKLRLPLQSPARVRQSSPFCGIELVGAVTGHRRRLAACLRCSHRPAR